MSELKHQLMLNKEMSWVSCYIKSEADLVIAELKNEIESMKVKFREFNDNVCKKIVDASRTVSTISQDAQMDFYEEFINGAK
jgi:hypothetical protein